MTPYCSSRCRARRYFVARRRSSSGRSHSWILGVLSYCSTNPLNEITSVVCVLVTNTDSPMARCQADRRAGRVSIQGTGGSGEVSCLENSPRRRHAGCPAVISRCVPRIVQTNKEHCTSSRGQPAQAEWKATCEIRRSLPRRRTQLSLQFIGGLEQRVQLLHDEPAGGGRVMPSTQNRRKQRIQH